MALAALPKTPPSNDDDRDDESGGADKMSFLEHLDELRKRLIKSVAALGVGFVISLFYINQLLDFIFKPLVSSIKGGKFQYFEPGEFFMMQMKLAALAGLFLALPVILWQIWRFVAPGLYANEKRLAIPFVFLSTVFFTLGASFSHFIAFPWTMAFFASFERDEIVFFPAIAPVFAMYVKMMLAMGLVFEMPTAVFFLARIGLVTAGFLLRKFKYAVLVIFIAAAILTPGTDVVSQSMMAGPMIGLYVLSIGIAWLVAKKKPSARDDADA
jgi:sec-independent protein translocase protein TatC